MDADTEGGGSGSPNLQKLKINFTTLKKINEKWMNNVSRGLNDDDWISGLPDHILIDILSLLTMDEAASTSVLSTRWKSLWTCIPELNFEDSVTLGEIELGNESLYIERLRYLRWVDQVVHAYQELPVKEFRVRFDLNNDHKPHIDTWVAFGLGKKVKSFELDLSDYMGISQMPLYDFSDIFHTIRNSSLQPLAFSSFDTLTILRFKSVNISGEVIEYFLSNCPLLEELCVDGSNSLIDLKVVGKLLKLKHLEIWHCFFAKSIEISAKHLVSFKYYGPVVRIGFKYVPELVEIYVGGDYIAPLNYSFSQLSTYLYQIESLTVNNMFGENFDILPVDIPRLCKLKHLKLIVSALDHDSLLGFTPLLEAFPYLYRFELELNRTKSHVPRQPERVRTRPHKYLKVVELSGFVGRTVDIELALYLFDNSAKLEKVTFDTREPLLSGSLWESLETESREAARRRARQLAGKLPPGTDIVII